MSFTKFAIGAVVGTAFTVAAAEDAEAQYQRSNPYNPYGYQQFVPERGYREGPRIYDHFGNNRGNVIVPYFNVPKGSRCPPGYSGSLRGNAGSGIRCTPRIPKY